MKFFQAIALVSLLNIGATTAWHPGCQDEGYVEGVGQPETCCAHPDGGRRFLEAMHGISDTTPTATHLRNQEPATPKKRNLQTFWINDESLPLNFIASATINACFFSCGEFGPAKLGQAAWGGFAQVDDLNDDDNDYYVSGYDSLAGTLYMTSNLPGPGMPDICPMDVTFDFQWFVYRNFGGAYNRYMSIQILDMGGNIVLEKPVPGTNTGNTGAGTGVDSNSGTVTVNMYEPGVFDSCIWGGKIRFAWHIPDSFTGPGQFVMDNLIMTPGGGGNGDPHFKKWNGQWFDFHGICDQVLVTSPDFDNGLGLDIHVRTKPRYEYSFIEATAVKIGEDIFQVGSFGQYWLNGVEGVELPITLANKYVVERVLDNKKQHKFVIHLDEAKKEFITIKVFKDMVNVNVEHATIANFGASSGLLGSFPEGKMMARDGATVIEDNNLFGQEWQVSASTDSILFLSPNPNQHIAGVCVPPVVSEEGRRRLGEQEIKFEAAEKACAQHKDQQKMDMCIMDVLAMGDLEVAEINGAY